MDRPDLSQSLRTVLAARGVSLAEIERILLAIAASPDPDAVTAILEARHPGRAAWMAAIDGHLSAHGPDHLLTTEAEPAGDYAPEPGRSIGGGEPVCSTDGKYRMAYRYGPLADRTLRCAPGTAVAAGELLTDGEADPHDVVEILGARETFTRLCDRLVSLCDLDATVAATIIAPMLDLVEISDPRDSRLRVGARMTTARFNREIGRVVGRQLARSSDLDDPRLLALAGMTDAERAEAYFDAETYQALCASLPPFTPPYARAILVGHPELATLDADGRLPGPHAFPLGSFEISTGALRVSDPGYYADSAGQRDLPAANGTWRAGSIVADRGPWGPRVIELRAWLERRAPDLEDAVQDAGFLVPVDSGLAGFFAVSDAAARVATREGFSPHCCALASAAGPPQAALVEPVGVVAFSGLGDGAYSCKVLYDRGEVIAVALIFD